MTIEMEIHAEIMTALRTLGADRELLATVGSWGDTLEDAEILRLLKEWNNSAAHNIEPSSGS